MFPGGIEYIDRERQKYLLQEAERMRLIRSLQQQKRDEPSRFWDIAHWFGIQLERWGQQLQHYSPRSTAQVKAISVTEVECPPY